QGRVTCDMAVISDSSVLSTGMSMLAEKTGSSLWSGTDPDQIPQHLTGVILRRLEEAGAPTGSDEDKRAALRKAWRQIAGHGNTGPANSNTGGVTP
ncbi:MAG: hypothetical protein M3O22_07850, partial [Pseudomonadota bacterium]|nr:hypothetical protein [Pseudomonadota bacterium]